jgi:hypothetical protein
MRLHRPWLGAAGGLAINPTLCDHRGSGAFLDMQGPFAAFGGDDDHLAFLEWLSATAFKARRSPLDL